MGLTCRERGAGPDLGEVRCGDTIHGKTRELHNVVLLKHAFIDSPVLKDKLSLQIKK